MSENPFSGNTNLSIVAGILRYLLRHGGGLLYLHLRQSRHRVLPAGQLPHEGRHSGGSRHLRHNGPAPDIAAHDELPAVELHNFLR